MGQPGRGARAHDQFSKAEWLMQLVYFEHLYLIAIVIAQIGRGQLPSSSLMASRPFQHLLRRSGDYRVWCVVSSNISTSSCIVRGGYL